MLFLNPTMLRWAFPMSAPRRIAAYQRDVLYHLFWPWVQK